MPKSPKNVLTILSQIVLLTFAVGLLLAIIGIFLVYLGASGDTNFNFFGQEFKSTNTGIAAIFIGASLIVLNTRRLLASLDKNQNPSVQKSPKQEGVNAKGKLRISDILTKQNKGPGKSGTCEVDFRVTNFGGSEVSINRVEFEVLNVLETKIAGYMEYSKTYDLDISKLERKGDTIDCPVSQVVKPGESDRFGIILIAKDMGTGTFRKWELQPTLHTNFGKVSGKSIEVWLPYVLRL